MKRVTTIPELRAQIHAWLDAKESIGFVPTMGALHQGHLSLVKEAKKTCTKNIVSIYVNPKQFGKNEDFSRYPRDYEHDIAHISALDCDLLFFPSDAEMYPNEFCSEVIVHGLSHIYEGALRPGHFAGVTTIVLKLLNLVQPTKAFFGQKDAQQVSIIKRMITDLALPVELVVMPTIREADGLAMSSRNVYLTPHERSVAPLLYQGLCRAFNSYTQGERNCTILMNDLMKFYSQTSLFSIDYCVCADPSTLQPREVVDDATILLVACRTTQTKTRLIDNLLLCGTV